MKILGLLGNLILFRYTQFRVIAHYLFAMFEITLRKEPCLRFCPCRGGIGGYIGFLHYQKCFTEKAQQETHDFNTQEEEAGGF